ncbi:MAG: hypothetical protein ACT4PT_02040 [Methanobacteriota archaeon]
MAKDDEIEEMRRLVREAAEAAKAARESAERVEGAQPAWWERLLTAVTALLKTLVDDVVGRLQREVQRAIDAGQVFIAQALTALSNSLKHLGMALIWAALALVLLTLAIATLTVGLAEVLNDALGAPWGWFATGGAYLLIALLALAAAKGRMDRIPKEADPLKAWARIR